MDDSDAFGVDESREAAAIDAAVSSLRTYFGKWTRQHCYLVVDPSQRDFTNDDKEAGHFQELTRAIVEIKHDAFPDSHRPYLVRLDLATPEGAGVLAESVKIAFEDRRPTSMAEGLGQRVGGWLASEASMDEVAEHWGRHVLQYSEEGLPCVLRFYDTRALSLIWPVLSQEQQQALLGPIKVWHALDASAKPCTYGVPAGSRADLSLTTEQWLQIHRHGMVNRALALYAMKVDRQPQQAEVAAAIAAAERAERYGLFDRDDQVAFIESALAWHPRFDLHPKVLQLLGARPPDGFYTAAVSVLTEEDIVEIRDGVWYERLSASSSR
ncbi:DUF4123 domain-containing protein [Burkholderia multivorans]|uniref:DUF4123 domain-containing protein n=1 Tax=Burkholderia multivorans TaxID=87883 RepID=UPI001C224F41|nr:DUF4123 domain-containing protein [Burkholderia multivorans]MBU9132009.1 DUF4123 domain-containing protein [Burkholderia multivorans]